MRYEYSYPVGERTLLIICQSLAKLSRLCRKDCLQQDGKVLLPAKQAKRLAAWCDDIVDCLTPRVPEMPPGWKCTCGGLGPNKTFHAGSCLMGTRQPKKKKSVKGKKK